MAAPEYKTLGRGLGVFQRFSIFRLTKRSPWGLAFQLNAFLNFDLRKLVTSWTTEYQKAMPPHLNVPNSTVLESLWPPLTW